jgi:hypothetical protein
VNARRAALLLVLRHKIQVAQQPLPDFIEAMFDYDFPLDVPA